MQGCHTLRTLRITQVFWNYLKSEGDSIYFDFFFQIQDDSGQFWFLKNLMIIISFSKILGKIIFLDLECYRNNTVSIFC